MNRICPNCRYIHDFGDKKADVNKNVSCPFCLSTGTGLAWIRANNKNHPCRAKARSAVHHALKIGKIERPCECNRCSKKCRPQGHHRCYEKENWLKVEWLCRACHGIADTEVDL